MIRLTLGLVNEGESISAMSILSLWTNYTALQEQVTRIDQEFELDLCIISNDQNSDFCKYAKLICPEARIFTPSDWNSFGFPPMSNGSYATYWKFDLIDVIQTDEILIYLDADAFILGDLNIKVLIQRLHNYGSQNGGCMLMVPAHRPVLERVGYCLDVEPFAYYNAGFFVAQNLTRVNKQKLKALFDLNFFGDDSRLFWHDQDLLNSYYSGKIHSLPFRYNISTGMLNKNNFGVSGINYLGAKEVINVVVAHASGGILFKKRHYTFRDAITKKAKNLLIDLEGDSETKDQVSNFLKLIQISLPYKHYLYFQNSLSKNGLKLFSEYDTQFVPFKLKGIIKRLIRK